jgi:hypothetical protein
MTRNDDPRDLVRDAMRRYPTTPARTRAAINAALSPQPTEAELTAGRILAEYGFTAEGIREGIAEGGTVEVLAFRDDEDGDWR